MNEMKKENMTQTNIVERVGYWFGGSLCLIAILALSFGIAPFLMSIRKGFTMVNIPGEQTLNLKLPGSYVALCLTKNLSQDVQQRLQELEYSLIAKKGTVPVELLKFPTKIYATDKKEEQTPLFYFTLSKTGQYFFSANYPYQLDGPKIQAVLYHTDLTYVRTELIIGISLFLILGIFGLYFIRKTYKAKFTREKM